MLLLFLTACGQPQHANEKPDNQDVEEHRDQWRPREAQSDFLDIGKQAGIEWLSFVPQDQLEYPEYFEGLDRDQKRRLRLAPKGSDEQVLLQFDLPEGSKLWPVDWYGTELMAIDTPRSDSEGRALTPLRYSVAVASIDSVRDDDGRRIAFPDSVQLNALILALSKRRWESVKSNWSLLTKPDGFSDGRSGQAAPETMKGTSGLSTSLGRWRMSDLGVPSSWQTHSYAARILQSRTADLIVVLELEAYSGNYDGEERRAAEERLQAFDVLKGISIKRELALEGSPKHKCSSSLEEQLRGTLRFPDGTLQLPIEYGQLVRKIGGDSTIQIDGEGAKPWILIRRLKEADTEGDLRARLRRDTTFNRRLKVPSAKFSTGYVPQDAKLPIVVFDYDDSSSENNLLGVLKAGNELLTFEVITQGVTDGDRRRAAKAAALKLLAGATGRPETQAPEFKPLIGWNAGDMGK
ncbi:MAG: hypothetical protein H6840_05320 [Planctomycetes bacterium]|nr:hypothetical protein [Planctomycetota bacterium]